MQLKILEISKDVVFLCFFKNLLKDIDVRLSLIFGKNKNVIKIMIEKISNFLADIL